MYFFLVLFILIPAIEIAVFIWVGSHIGALNVFFLILLTSFLGALIARFEGMETLRKAQMSMERHEVPRKEMLDGVLIFVGGILLITPGFATDLLGLLFVLPFIRPFFRKWLSVFVKKQIEKGMIYYRRW